MKKEYKKPEVEIYELDVEDIITASGNFSKKYNEDLKPDKEGNWEDLFK